MSAAYDFTTNASLLRESAIGYTTISLGVKRAWYLAIISLTLQIVLAWNRPWLS